MESMSDEDTEESLESLREKHDRLQKIYQVSNLIHSTLEPESALRLVLGEAIRLTRATSGSIALVNPTTGYLEIQVSHALPTDAVRCKLRIGEGITGWVARTGTSARVDDVTIDPRYVLLRPNARSELAVPLQIEGEVRGAINVDSDRCGAFTAADEALLSELSVQAARVIENTWLYEQFRLKARLFESLVKVSQTINSTMHLTDALAGVTRESCALMTARMASILMLDSTGEWLELKASFQAGEAYRAMPRLNVAESLLGIVVRRQKPVQVANVQISGRYQRGEIARLEGLVSLLSVPLVFGKRAIGVLNVYTGEPHSFSNEEIRILTALAELSAIAIEKARLHERIVETEEHLRQNEKLSALGLLAAEVAHEIRNPLTVMKMLFHSLDLRFPPSDPRSRDVTIMSSKMDHLNRIVEKILDFARSTEPRFSAVNINGLIDDLGILTRHKLRTHQIELVRRLDPDLPEVRGDPRQLEQAFLNLTLNAVQAMPRGGRLSVRSRLEGGKRSRPPDVPNVVIEFKDTGEGMTEEQRHRAFTSLLSSSKPGGTGLGLAIVQRVVETHGGRLKLRSRINKGTTISLILPVSGDGAGTAVGT